MEIAHLCWLERRPTLRGADEEILNYKLQLLVENRLVPATAAALRHATRTASNLQHPLSFAVPGSFNGRLFDCRLTVTAVELDQPHWKGAFEQRLRVLCRANEKTPATIFG